MNISRSTLFDTGKGIYQIQVFPETFRYLYLFNMTAISMYLSEETQFIYP